MKETNRKKTVQVGYYTYSYRLATIRTATGYISANVHETPLESRGFLAVAGKGFIMNIGLLLCVFV